MRRANRSTKNKGKKIASQKESSYKTTQTTHMKVACRHSTFSSERDYWSFMLREDLMSWLLTMTSCSMILCVTLMYGPLAKSVSSAAI